MKKTESRLLSIFWLKILFCFYGSKTCLVFSKNNQIRLQHKSKRCHKDLIQPARTGLLQLISENNQQKGEVTCGQKLKWSAEWDNAILTDLIVNDCLIAHGLKCKLLKPNSRLPYCFPRNFLQVTAASAWTESQNGNQQIWSPADADWHLSRSNGSVSQIKTKQNGSKTFQAQVWNLEIQNLYPGLLKNKWVLVIMKRWDHVG